MSPIIQMTHFTSDDIEQKANKKPVMHLSKSDIKQSRKQMIILLIIFASFITLFSIYDCKQLITQINSLKTINTKHEEKINSFDVSITTIKNEFNDLVQQKDNLDRELLNFIIKNYDGGPVGIETIATAWYEDVRTIEDVYEPYLMQLGLLQRTPRGRMVSPEAYRHLGISQNNSQQRLF